MEYVPEGGKVEKTLMLVGKGITYDTGGADIKAGGIMAGMSRDKGGASDVAGIVKTISMLKPKNLKVRMICRLRNLQFSFLCHQIFPSRSLGRWPW